MIAVYVNLSLRCLQAHIDSINLVFMRGFLVTVETLVFVLEFRHALFCLR